MRKTEYHDSHLQAFENVVNYVCKNLKLDRQKLFSKGRYRYSTFGRYFIAYLLNKKEKLDVSLIADMMNTDRTNIYDFVLSAEYNCKQIEKYKKLINDYIPIMPINVYCTVFLTNDRLFIQKKVCTDDVILRHTIEKIEEQVDIYNLIQSAK